MVDFENCRHPALVIPCPTCGAKAHTVCIRPSEHRTRELHKERKEAVDQLFIAQFGEDAWVERLEDGWKVHLSGRCAAITRDAPETPIQLCMEV